MPSFYRFRSIFALTTFILSYVRGVHGFTRPAINCVRYCGADCLLPLSSDTEAALDVAVAGDDAASTIDGQVIKILEFARSIGPVGTLASEADQQRLVDLCSALPSPPVNQPARQDLFGTHNLVYSASTSASSGKLGNFVGKVTQEFMDDQVGFINGVSFLGGIVQVRLRAERDVKNDTTNKVTFLETFVQLFGKTVVERESKGGGTWKYLYMGEVTVPDNGKRKLVRIMETPSLFVIEQDLA